MFSTKTGIATTGKRAVIGLLWQSAVLPIAPLVAGHTEWINLPVVNCSIREPSSRNRNVFPEISFDARSIFGGYRRLVVETMASVDPSIAATP